MFELADREFRAIRDETTEAINATEAYEAIEEETADGSNDAPQPALVDKSRPHFTKLDAFSLLRIAHHFFPNEEFEAHKIDGFTEEVVRLEPSISRARFNFYLRETIGEIRRYKVEFEAKPENGHINPFTEMRHCLYMASPEKFTPMLTDRARESLDIWAWQT